jgi:5'-deoxynucleotidase YfbR-like HD superfamily hydrolase
VIIILLHPNPSIALLKAAILHDAPERVTGDFPAPIKWANPVIGQALEFMERRIFDAVLGYDPIAALDDDEKEWLKAADSFDLWLTCCDFLLLGHTFCRDYMDALEREILAKHFIPNPIRNIWEPLTRNVALWANATKEIS